jgi:lactoylglutathione lyase
MSEIAFSLLVLKTRQVEHLRTFYETLGVTLADEQHGRGPAHLAGKVGDVSFEIYSLQDDGTAVDSTTRLGFAVNTLVKVVETLQTLGITIVSQPKSTEWGYRAVVRDPDGRAVELYQR